MSKTRRGEAGDGPLAGAWGSDVMLQNESLPIGCSAATTAKGLWEGEAPAEPHQPIVFVLVDLGVTLSWEESCFGHNREL